MNRRWAAYLVASSMLSACVGGHRAPSPLDASDVPSSFANGVATGDEERRPTAFDADDAWLAILADPALLSLVAEAQKRSSEIRGLQARVERARAFVRVARATLSPSVNLELAATGVGGFSPEASSEGLVTVGLVAAWEPDVFGRLRLGATSSEHELAASVADHQAARRVLTGAVAEAYFLAVEAKLQVGVSRRNNEQLSSTLGYVETQFERGLRSGQDLALIRADAATARSSLADTKGAQRAALRALEELIGRFPSANVDIGDSLAVVPSSMSAAIPATILEQRPDVLAAAERIRAAQEARGAAVAERLPRVGFRGSIVSEASSLDEVAKRASVVWRLGASVTVPLVDGGRRRAVVESSSATLDEAVSNYNATALAAFREVENGLDRARVLEVRESALKTALAEASKALKFARFRYELGESDLLDVLSIQRRVSSIESQLVATQRARLVQYVTLALALGSIPQPLP